MGRIVKIKSKKERLALLGFCISDVSFPLSFSFLITFKDRLAHHRWLLFFQFGQNENSNDPELKKLKTLLKNEYIQVRKIYSAYPSAFVLSIHSLRQRRHVGRVL